MYGLDLFSGIGGLTVALEPWVQPVAYCENDRFCQAVLLSRMREGTLPLAPIWDDIQTLRGNELPPIDIIYGGFPCQDLSVASHGAGLAGKRSGLFFQIVRLARELRPRFIFLENVPAITLRGLDRILLEFTALGYDCRWTIISAAEMGACHIRQRWFLLAYAHILRLREKQGEELPTSQRSLESDGTSSERAITRTSERRPKPRVDRAGDGFPYRMDCHRALGNSVVPAAAREAFKRLFGLNKPGSP